MRRNMYDVAKSRVEDRCSDCNLGLDIIIRSPAGGNVLDVAGLRAACELDNTITYYRGGSVGCGVECMRGPDSCSALSFTSLLLRARGKHCSDLDESDVRWARESLARCETGQDTGPMCAGELHEMFEQLFVARSGNVSAMESRSTRVIKCIPESGAKGLDAEMKYITGLYSELLEPAGREGYQGLEISFWSQEMFDIVQRAALLFDVELAFLAGAIMFFVILLHTGSLFITVLSTLQIAAAFPATYLVRAHSACWQTHPRPSPPPADVFG